MKFRSALQLGILATAAFGTAASWLLLRRARGKGYYDKLPVYRLTNNAGMSVEISPLGASILKMLVPDKQGKKADVVLGWGSVEEYVTGEPTTYFGVIVGRVANRIANAKFTLNGETYELLANNGPNALHGGALGLHKRVWEARTLSGPESSSVVLEYQSPPGEEGYPGTLHVVVVYSLAKNKNELTCHISAMTDEPTPVNIAQHSYFNLAGHASGSTILDHVVRIPTGDHITPVSASLIPTGEVTPVAGTPFDFTQPHAIGERIEQVPGAPPGGYDHNYVLFNMGPQARFIVKKGVASEKPKLAATVKDPKSGRVMEVLTTAPGMQFYTGNFLDGSITGKDNAVYQKHAGFCMETQGFPNSINQPNFPSVVIEPEDEYSHTVVYRFSNE